MIWSNTGSGRRDLHDLGDCEVKHGVRLHVVNLYTEQLGNPEVPEKFRQMAATATASAPMPSPAVKPKRMPWQKSSSRFSLSPR